MSRMDTKQKSRVGTGTILGIILGTLALLIVLTYVTLYS